MAKVGKIQVTIPVTFLREDDVFIAHSPVLDLSTSGKDMEQVRGRFSEVVSIFFEELLSKGTLDEVLTGLGWKRVKKRWSPPVPVDHKMEKIEVPLSR